MNALKSYINEGLFSSDSIDNQIDNQYYNNILEKIKSNVSKSFILKNSSHIDKLFKLDKDEITIYLDEVSYIILNDNLINMINNCFCYFKNVNFVQIKNYAFILIKKKIDNNIAKSINKFFKSAIFHHIEFYDDADGLSLNMGMKKGHLLLIVSENGYKINNLNLNIVDMSGSVSLSRLLIDVINPDTLSEIEVNYKNTKVKNNFQNLIKKIRISDKDIYKYVAQLVQTYLFAKDKNKGQLADKYYNALNKFVHELIESNAFFDEKTEMILKTNSEKFTITVKNNKIFLKYNTDAIFLNEVIEFPY